MFPIHTYNYYYSQFPFLQSYDSLFAPIWPGLDALAIAFSEYYNEIGSGEKRDVRYIHDFPSNAEIFGFDIPALEQAQQRFRDLYGILQNLGHLSIINLERDKCYLEEFSRMISNISVIRRELLMPVMGWANTDSSNHMLFLIGRTTDNEFRHRLIVVWTFMDLYSPPAISEIDDDLIENLKTNAISEFHSKIHLIRSCVTGIIKTIRAYQRFELNLENRVNTGYQNITNTIHRMLEHEKFFHDTQHNWGAKSNYILILNFMGNLLGRCYDEPSLLRTKATTWQNEVGGMHPWLNDLLRTQFGDRFTYNSSQGGGICDQIVYQIPIECKLLKLDITCSETDNPLDNTITKIWDDYRGQILQYAGTIGFGILCVVDIRPKIVNSDIFPFPLQRCIDIVEVNGVFLALFLYQGFTRRPSDRS